MKHFDDVYNMLMESLDLTTIRPGSVVRIKASALSEPEIIEHFNKCKGRGYIDQLKRIANEGIEMYVSALKTIRPVDNVHAVQRTSGDFQEADLVTYAPGMLGVWGNPITLPLSILETVTAPEDIMQKKIPGEVAKPSREEADNSYNKGKQHPNTVGKK